MSRREVVVLADRWWRRWLGLARVFAFNFSLASLRWLRKLRVRNPD